MKYLSVCSGIEAATVAWHPLGWEPVAFSEVNPFASAVLAHHWPHVPNLGDMTKHENWPIEPGSIELLVGGTPCQSFSVAGLRRGLADPRGNLALVYLAILDRLRPRWCVWENVPGVLSSNGGRDFGAFLGALAQLGYGFAYRVLDAQYVRVDGYERAVPQRRRRVFVVGCAGGDWQRAAQVLLEPSSVRGDSATREPTRETSTGSTRARAASCREKVIPEISNALTANVRLSIDQETFLPEVCGIIADGAHYGGGANGQDAYTGRIIPVLETDIVAHTLSTQSAWATEDGTGRGSPLVAVSSGRGWRSESEVGATVRAQDSANNLLAFDEQQITSKTNRSGVPLVPERFIPIVSDPITAHEIKTYTHEGKSFRLRNCVTDEQHVHDISCDLDEDCMCSPSRFVGVRRLTPRECERLQGFPDDHTLVPHRGKEAMDGPRYRAIGNSMAVNAMRWIGRRIEQVEGKR